jgi:hypothetical protein
MQQRVLIIILMILLIISCSKKPSGILINHIHETDNSLNYRIDIDYPTFTDSQLNIINQQVKGNIDSNIFEFKKFILDFEGSSPRTLKYQYAIKTDNGHLISIAQQFAWAVPGVERILYQHCNINYNRNSGSFIKIDDLFQPKSNFKDSLTAIINTKLKQEFRCKLDTTENFENFYFNADSLFFNLTLTDQSQCDDYSISIDKKRLEKILKYKVQ